MLGSWKHLAAHLWLFDVWQGSWKFPLPLLSSRSWSVEEQTAACPPAKHVQGQWGCTLGSNNSLVSF